MKFKLIAPFRTYFYINIGFRSFLKSYYSENNDYYEFWKKAKENWEQNQTHINSQNGQPNEGEQQCEFESKNRKLEFKNRKLEFKKQKCEFENGTKCKLKDIRKYKFEDVKKCRIYQDIEKSIEVEFLHLDSKNKPDPPVSRYAEISSNDLAFNEKIEIIEFTVKKLPECFIEEEEEKKKENNYLEEIKEIKKIEKYLDCNRLQEFFDGSKIFLAIFINGRNLSINPNLSHGENPLVFKLFANFTSDQIFLFSFLIFMIFMISYFYLHRRNIL
ncbi:MAG: hypothetical protein QNJ41_08535 [Xenococcaceae cyanobacterium MO_188.B32]|nr:hypothetical protein [Xenococcaceae cyanobacterium MO_188.B32]